MAGKPMYGNRFKLIHHRKGTLRNVRKTTHLDDEKRAIVFSRKSNPSRFGPSEQSARKGELTRSKIRSVKKGISLPTLSFMGGSGEPDGP